MKKLWLFLEESALEEKNKNAVFIVISVTMANLLGAALWLLIGRLLLPGTEWLMRFYLLFTKKLQKHDYRFYIGCL